MSGICGIVDFAGTPASAKILRTMVQAAAYRGCDGHRQRILGEVGLAHLALHDTLESAADCQPLSTSDHRLLLVADVRLDNRKDLMARLEDRLTSTSPSDSELVLAAYQQWGHSCPKHLLGDFALAIWDSREKRLFCARDPLGIKPLQFARLGSLLLFASEAQQILQHPSVPRRLDQIMMGSYLCGMSPGLERTLFNAIKLLPPAHLLVADAQGIRRERYWDVDPAKRTIFRHSEDYACQFYEIFHRAVADRLRASGDAVGVVMSGGLDSCAVASVANEELRRRQCPTRLVASSLVFTRLSGCDERSYIRPMVAALGIEAMEVEAEDFWPFKDPVIDRPSIETLYMSFETCFREILDGLRDKGCRVVLTGNGGDEVVAGSGRVFADRLAKGDLGALVEILRCARQRRKAWWRALYYYAILPFLSHGANQSLRRLTGRAPQFNVPSWISKDFVKRNDLMEHWRRQSTVGHLFEEKARQAVYENAIGPQRNAPAIYWYNRIASLSGMEMRHPFLDRRLIEFVLSIPSRQLFEAETTKPLLRKAMKGKLTELVLHRKNKTNFVSYIDWTLRKKESRTVERLLEDPISAKLGISDGKKLRAAFQKYRAGELSTESRCVVYATTLEMWLRKHFTEFEDSVGLGGIPYVPRSDEGCRFR